MLWLHVRESYKLFFLLARKILLHWEIRFKQNSKHGIISGCGGCLDGVLSEINCCLKKNFEIPPIHITLDIFVAMAWIFKPVCDANMHFTYPSLLLPWEVTLPGYFGEALSSFNHISVATWFVNHRICCIHWIWPMLAPFTGSSCQHPSKDAYDYFLSQMQIWIETSLSILTNMWQVLQS